MVYPFQPNFYDGFPQSNGMTNQQFGMANSRNSLIERLRDELPPTFTRQFVCEKLGGLITPKTLANLDSLREGPGGRIRVGKKIGYQRDDFLDWLERRIQNQ